MADTNTPPSDQQPAGTVKYYFDQGTIELVVRGLKKLPYEEVAATIEAIVNHAHATLFPPPPAKPKRKKKEPAAPAQG